MFFFSELVLSEQLISLTGANGLEIIIKKRKEKHQIQASHEVSTNTGCKKSNPSTLIKKKIKFSSYIGKFRVEQLQSHISGSPSSYMTLQLLHSEFTYI
jgi:hypothetical protein